MPPAAPKREVRFPALETTPTHGSRYIRLTDGPVARTLSLSESVLVDLDAEGRAVGVEVL